MLTGLLHAHSGLRYLVLLAGAVALAYTFFSVVTRRPYDRSTGLTVRTFAGLLHLQVLVGFVFLVSGQFYPALIGHIFTMLLAAASVQVPLSVLRRRPPEGRGPLPLLIGTAVALVLIWAGVASIGRGLLDNSF